MKINQIQHLISVDNNKNNKVSAPVKNDIHQTKKGEGSLMCGANYNIAFCGLFKKEKIQQSIAERGTKITEPIYMSPNKEYIISDETSFIIGGYPLTLKNEEIEKKLNSLPSGEELIIGRNTDSNLPASVSRNHLKIRKSKGGVLTATDLDSLNGSIILPDTTKINPDTKNFKIQPQKNYLIPKQSLLSLGNTIVALNDYASYFSEKENDNTLIIGRDNYADITLTGPTVSRRHLEVTKTEDGYVIRDLNSTNGTCFILDESERIAYGNDYSAITDITTLNPEIPTLLPPNSQLNLGEEFTLDMRNPNLIKMLNEKGKIKIGRNPYCDIRVNGFYDKVSREHIILQKDGKNIIATDMSPRNATRVIPQNKIRAFYSGVKNIRLAQSNIGDCYLLSTVYALSQNPKGQILLENMVSVDKEGNYIVKFANNNPIKVKPEELDGQKDSNTDKNRPEKYSVSGELGAKAIERAYAKLLKHEHENNDFTMFAEIDKGGRPETALKKMTGIEGVCYYLSQVEPQVIFSKILKAGRDNTIVTCNTPAHEKCGKYADKEHRFLAQHSYAIKNIDELNNTVEIVNPHNTKISEIISWNDFARIFEDVDIAKI